MKGAAVPFNQIILTQELCVPIMSRTMAEARLPQRVDAAKLVELNQRFSAEIDSEKLPRLMDAVESCVEPVFCEIEFDRDEERNRVLTGSCKTQVVMICQRCLGAVTVPVESSFQLGLVFNDEQAKQLPRRLEPVELDEDARLELWETIEDEVLLALPSFPTHPESECQIKQPTPETSATEDSDVKRPNPFDVLAQLKQK